MIICPNCGAEVGEGKFCEKCGSPLINVAGSANSQSSLFDKIKSQANKAASDLLALKSDFSNGNILFKVTKIPSVQEKKIKIENNEFAYFNNGSGFIRHKETFITPENSFVCYYIKKETQFSNILNISLRPRIKKIETDDVISASLKYELSFFVENVDVFFNKLISLKQDTWKVIDINSTLSTKLNEVLLRIVSDGISNDGNLDLKDTKRQIEGFSSEIIKNINSYVGEYGLKLEAIDLDNVSLDVNEINRVLINYIYR